MNQDQDTEIRLSMLESAINDLAYQIGTGRQDSGLGDNSQPPFSFNPYVDSSGNWGIRKGVIISPYWTQEVDAETGIREAVNGDWLVMHVSLNTTDGSLSGYAPDIGTPDLSGTDKCAYPLAQYVDGRVQFPCLHNIAFPMKKRRSFAYWDGTKTIIGTGYTYYYFAWSQEEWVPSGL